MKKRDIPPHLLRYFKPRSVIKPKDDLAVPNRVALALQAAGWYVRNDIIWHRRNAKPESVRDRFSMDYEHVFLLSKTEKYYFDQEAVREPHATPANEQIRQKKGRGKQAYAAASGVQGQPPQDSHGGLGFASGGRNRRCVWLEDGQHLRLRADLKEDQLAFALMTLEECFEPAEPELASIWSVNTKPTKAAHFATFPPGLVRIPLLAGTSAGGACVKCGVPRVRVTAKGEPDRAWQAACGGNDDGQYTGVAQKQYEGTGAENASDVKRRILEGMRPKITLGWASACRCGTWTCKSCGRAEEIETGGGKPKSDNVRVVQEGVQHARQAEEVLRASVCLSEQPKAIGSSVPEVRRDFSSGQPSESLLQHQMRGDTHSTDTPIHSGLDTHTEGVYPCSCEGSPQRDEVGVRNAAPIGDGGALGKAASFKRSGSPSQSDQGRQSAGESGADDKEGSRFQVQGDLAGQMPKMLTSVSDARKCPDCSALMAFVPSASVPCKILDCFGGSGTVGEVAHQLGLDCTLIELQPDYVPLIQERVAKVGGTVNVVGGPTLESVCMEIADLLEKRVLEGLEALAMFPPLAGAPMKMIPCESCVAHDFDCTDCLGEGVIYRCVEHWPDCPVFEEDESGWPEDQIVPAFAWSKKEEEVVVSS